MRHPELIALYASAPSHDFGHMLGLPGSCVRPPYVPFSAKAAPGEPLRLHPGSAGRVPQWRKLKQTVMIGRETGRCSRGFFESLKAYAASGGELAKYQI